MRSLSVKLWLLAVLLASMTMGAAPLWAQATGQIRGTVTSETGQPLSGVAVMVVGTRMGTLTQANGAFTISDVPAGAQRVRAQLIGYGSVEQQVTVAADQTASVSFQLQPEAVELEAIVAVGYGTQKREEVTGAVSSVGAEQFVEGPARDAASLIAGKIAGLAVSTPTGDPTRGSEIILRGQTTLQGPANPLILVDGVPGDLSTVPPEEIESISVLKDGSAAAVYGSRASNGVILITTKRYRGGAPTLRYDGYVSQQRINRSPQFLTADDYRRLIGEGYKFTDFGHSTDWQAAVLRQPVSHRHNVSLIGGAANTSYSASLNVESTEGIFLRSDNEQLTGRLNLQHSMFDGRLDLEANVLTGNQTYFTGPDFNWAWQMAVQRNPTDAIRDENGNWLETSTGALRYQNPVSLIMEENGQAELRTQRLHSTVTYRPIDALRLSVLAGTSRSNLLTGSATTFRHQSYTQENSGGTAERSTSSGLDRILEATGTLADRIGNHSVTLLGGYSYQDFLDEEFYARNTRFPTDLFGWDQLQRGSGLVDGLAAMGGDKSSYKVIGFFSRLNYDWNNRFLLMGSLRYEGNSRFGADHKWGVFPAISAGWRLSEESFLEGLTFLNDLKLRAGYGVTGIAPDRSYLSLTSYGYAAKVLHKGKWVQTLEPTRNPNPDLRWERKEEINVGLDYSLFGARLSGSVDLYRRDTKDMLFNYSVPVPPNLYNRMLANVGHMQNQGVEVQLSYDVIDRGDFRWTSSANWSHNTNKLISLSNDVFQANDFFYTGHTAAPIQQTTHRVEVGQPIGNFYGFKSVDIDENGVWIVLNKDGERISITDVHESDRQILGNGIPKHFFAWNNAARYRNLDLSVNLRGAADFQILNFLRMYYENPKIVQYNMLQSAFDPVYGKRPVNYDLAYVSYYIENGDYLKLDNATLGYTFGDVAAGALSGVLSNARIYVSGRNLLTVTGYKGIDPEVTTTGLAPGNDNRASYPTTRMLTAGMTLTF